MLNSNTKQYLLNDQQRIDFSQELLAVNGVTSSPIKNALCAINRYLFFPDNMQSLAYTDLPIEVHKGRYILDIATIGYMLMVAEIKPYSNVLVLGSNTGYTAAVLSTLCQKVYALEKDAELHEVATLIGSKLKIKNIAYINGDIQQPSAYITDPIDIVILEGAYKKFLPNWSDFLANTATFVGALHERNYSRIVKILKVENNLITKDYKQAPIPLLNILEKTPEFIF